MRRGSTLRGVFVLMVAMMMIAAGSAYVAVVDFEDPGLAEGDVVEGWGAVHDYLKITPWAEFDGADAQIIVDGGAIKAYQGGSNGSGWPSPGNNLCLEDEAGDQGLGTEFAIPDTADATWRFDFAPGIFVDEFSIDMLDYGDWFPFEGNVVNRARTATMTAYNTGGIAVDSDSFTATKLSAALYDSCAAGGEGIQRLGVSSDLDIAYVEITFDGVDTGIAFDNIEFNYLCALPQEFDLIAGQHDDVGTVLVWDDGESIFVKYVVDDPWMIEEIHLAVGETVADIPGNKGGPIPGKFPIKDYFDPLTSVAPLTGAYEIPYDEVLYSDGTEFTGGTVVVAAHAAVWDTSTEVTETVARSEVGVGIDVYGPSGSYMAPNDPAWVGPVDAVNTWTHPSWPMLADTEAVWIADAVEILDPVETSTWRWFQHDFDVPGYPTGATVGSATSDNAEEVYLNGMYVGHYGEVQGPFVDNLEWNWVVDYLLAPVQGTNTLEFIVRNYGLPGATWDSNPTGLIYSVDASYYERGETAWGSDDNCLLDGKNWALCIEYTTGVCPVPPLTVSWTVDSGSDVKTADYFTNPDGSFDQWRDAATAAATGFTHLVFYPAPAWTEPVCDPGVKHTITNWPYNESRYDFLGGPHAPLTDGARYQVCLYE